MKVLVTGASGFVGKHLLSNLIINNIEVVAITRIYSKFLLSLNIPVYELDIVDFDKVLNCIKKEKPDVLVHLAAQSNVGTSWQDYIVTSKVNIEGSLNLYKAFFKINPQGKFINIGSSDEYGLIAKLGIPLSEEMECKPQNPYSISKYCSEQMLLQLSKKDKVNFISTRSFNHFGPGQNPGFVISDFASQIAKIKLGLLDNKLFVGNLSSSRDFLYISDVIEAYILIIKMNIDNGIYNISSGKSYKINHILDVLINLSEMDINIIVDKNKFRPIEVMDFCGSNKKFNKATSWVPRTDIIKGLENTLDYWYTNISK